MEYYTLFVDLAVGAEVVNNKSNTEHSTTRFNRGRDSQKAQLIAEETLVLNKFSCQYYAITI